MMNEMDGFHAYKAIRKSKDIPVLMLSARGTEYDKLFGFEVGVDDYLIKLFSPKELMARVNVIIKRHQHTTLENHETDHLKFNSLEIDALGHNVYVDGEIIDLSKLVKSVIVQFEPLFQSQGDIIECSVSENINVNGNHRQLERVVYNLLCNAIHHTGDSKKITIRLQSENGHAQYLCRITETAYPMSNCRIYGNATTLIIKETNRAFRDLDLRL